MAEFKTYYDETTHKIMAIAILPTHQSETDFLEELGLFLNVEGEKAHLINDISSDGAKFTMEIVRKKQIIKDVNIN